MSIKFEELPDWVFDADEISAGVYKAFGMSSKKRSVEKTGTDPEMLIQQCRQAAIEIMQDEHINIQLSRLRAP